MYPRNAASPPAIAVGTVVQISDGAVQTASVLVRVKTGTGAWGAGAGTLACDTTSGIWEYTPTQAETDATGFMVAIYKSGCLPASQSVITTASSVAGNVQLAASQPAVTYTSLTITGQLVISNGIDVSCSTADRVGFKIRGNGLGHGMDVAGGTTAGASGALFTSQTYGNGIYATGAGAAADNAGLRLSCASGGSALYAGGAGTSTGLTLAGGSTAGSGLYVTSTSGSAALFWPFGSANDAGITAIGKGNQPGLKITGGATGNGVTIAAGATSGVGVAVTGSGSDAGLTVTGGATGTGATIAAGGGNGVGVVITGAGAGAGVAVTGGATGNGVTISAGATSGHGLLATGSDSGSGLRAIGGSSSGSGAYFASGASGGAGISATSATGTGLSVQGGYAGITAVGGYGVYIFASGYTGLTIACTGANNHGVDITGGTSGVSDGVRLTAGAGGVALRANSITGDITGNINGNLTGSIGSLDTGAKSDVNLEVVDALNVDNYGEPGQEAPPVSASLITKLSYLYKAWRNKKTQDGSTFKLYADDEATVDQKSATSDAAGTTTVGEVGTGP